MTKSKLSDNELIGKRFKSRHCNHFTVTGLSKERQNGMKMYDVIFDEINGVAYKTTVRKESIIKGSIVNRYYPTVRGIGYLGDCKTVDDITVYERWNNMIDRCYNVDSHRYSSYGAKGVTVCDRWLCFSNYLNDFYKLDGYDKDNIDNLEVDKDIKIKGNTVYSPDTCIFITREENTKEQNERNSQVYFIAESPDGNIYESNNQHEFAKTHSMKNKGISSVLRGTQKTHRGWKFRYK